MLKQFWQVDVTDREDNIWTGPVVYGSHQEAEFRTMLELQSDWGDSYMPEGFLDMFGRTDGDDLFERSEDVDFPGDDAWDTLEFWDQLDVNVFMLKLGPVTALAKLGKIECDLSDETIDAVMTGLLKLELAVMP